ncbi:hypothetical protein ACHAWX_005241 [Stephanocyclus meneghinianus]
MSSDVQWYGHEYNASSTAVDWINDLTYSDDENDSIWDLLERHDYSSPEAMEPLHHASETNAVSASTPQDQLFHPLARGDSAMTMISDDGSHLAFSLSSLPGDEERWNLHPSPASYGSIEDTFKKPTFRHGPSLLTDRTKHSPLHPHAPSPARTKSRAPSPQNRTLLSSPLPTLQESPPTSATATDDTLSPPRIEPKKRRRQKRLRRVQKAAEAREAAVHRVRGAIQPDEPKDAPFAAVFWAQFALVAVGALRDRMMGGETSGVRGEDYDPFEGLHSDDVVISFRGEEAAALERGGLGEEGGISRIDFVNVVQLVTIAGGYASLCSLLALGFMMMLSKNILHVMLIFTVGVSLVWTVVGFTVSAGWIVPLAGGVALLLSFFYTVVVWDRIPFAATNLSVALKGMRSALDIPLMGVCVLIVSFLWTIWWICSFVGVFDFLEECEQLSNDWLVVVIVFYLFSYYWTIQVIKGISQATVAGIIGQWWNHEDSLPVCSSALRDSLHHNLSRSFGSICLGALVIDPCVLYHRVSNFFRLAKPKLGHLTKQNPQQKPETERLESKNASSKSDSCSFDENIIYRNVNQWSYTYISLYGYKFWESGNMAFQLFQARGWTHVVSDDLILTALSMTSMVIGGSTACLGLIVEEVDGFSFTTLHKPIVTAFLVGLFVGLVLSSTFLSIIEGSVNAILVSYASAPVDFHANHPSLSDELKSVWKEFWLPRG